MQTETEKKLEEAKIKRNAIFADIESLTANEKAADAEIARLTEQLAEEKKPKLSRDGDYSIRNKGIRYVHIRYGTDIFNNYGGKNPNGYDPEIDIFQGNIFDDLAALSKPLDKFELDVHSYYINAGKGWGNAKIHMAGNNHTEEEVEQHITNLKRLLATLKRKEGK